MQQVESQVYEDENIVIEYPSGDNIDMDEVRLRMAVAAQHAELQRFEEAKNSKKRSLEDRS